MFSRCECDGKIRPMRYNLEMTPSAIVRKTAPDGSVEPFPRARFLEFIRVLKIQSRDEGLTNFQLLGSQLYVLDEICAGITEGVTTFVVLKARQLGITTFMLALDLFWAFEHDGLMGAFITHDEASREQFRNQIELFLEMLPKSHRVDAQKSNSKMLVLRNGSFFRYLVAGLRAGNNNMGRSGSANFFHSTETAFYGSPDNITAFNQSTSQNYAHRLYVYESTANGFNHYSDMWETAQSSPAQRAIFVGWWRNELFEFGSAHPLFQKYMPQGLRTPLNGVERRRVKLVKERYGFEITAGQIAWYRWNLETNCNKDQSQADQELPWVAEDAFVATGAAFFSNESLTDQMRRATKMVCQPFIFRLTNNWYEVEIINTPISNCTLKIWEQPSAYGTYVMGCDPAYGSSPEADHCVISIFRCYADKLVQVAEYCSVSTSTYQCAWVIAYLGGLYGDIMLNLEITGPGLSVFQELTVLKQNLSQMPATGEHSDWRNCLSKMREFLYHRADSLGGGLVRHWKTTFETKQQIMFRLRDMLDLSTIEIRSLAALEELRKTVITEGSIEAFGRGKDDRVMAAALANWAWEMWVRPSMKANGRTFEREQNNAVTSGERNVGRVLFEKFLKDRNIKVKDRAEY